jgi:SAM-dependent methyltransferase
MSSLTLFDSLAGAYESWFDTPGGQFVARREKEMIANLLLPKRGEAILEVGAGTGYFLREIAASGAHCIGLEPSSEMLAVALSRPGPALDYIRGVGEALPFEDDAFDALLYMTTLEFVQDVDAALREAARVVRAGGRLAFGVLNAAGPWAAARRREGGFWSEARFFAARELRALLSPLGPVQIESCVHVPPRFLSLPATTLRPLDAVLRRLLPASGALIGARVTLRR